MPSIDDLILGVALDATPGIPGGEILSTQLRVARLLDESGFDLVTLGDPPRRDSSAGNDVRFDALSTLAAIGVQTRQIGLVPAVPTTHTEPFHVATATATLDYSGRARAGWLAGPSLDERSARAIGRRRTPEPEPAWAETLDVIDTVRALWDSWEHGAEIRDARSARFLDLSKVHYVEASITDSAGERYGVKGPSIVPRPPQGNPPVVVRADDPVSLRAAAAAADVILASPGLADAPAAAVEAATAALRNVGRSASVAVLAEVPAPAVLDGPRRVLPELAARVVAAGGQGLQLVPGDLVADTAALADAVRGGNWGDGAASGFGVQRSEVSLRERLGLSPAINRFAG